MFYLKKEQITNNMAHFIPVFILDDIDSTNRFAKELSFDYALVVSNKQTLGRGRLGRGFYSPQGGIYMSLLAKVPFMYQNIPFITTSAAVAVHKAIKSLYNKNVSIKWINDIYLDGKKVSGILCESADSEHAVIGIGINFAVSDFPNELKEFAASLFESDTDNNPNILISQIIDNLLDIILNLPDTSFMDYYKENSLILNKEVLITKDNTTFCGKAVDIDSQGALIVETPQGIQKLTSGDITIRLKN